MTLEVDVARPIVAWLRDAHWEVFQEVRLGMGRPTADIVAKRGSILWVIETKTRLNFDVMYQADFWLRRGLVNMASIGVPHAKHGDGRRWALAMLRERGLGVIEAWKGAHPGGHDTPVEWARPRLHRKRGNALEKRLHEAQKTYAEAGNAMGLAWSPFKSTCERVAAHVTLNPGLTLQELVRAIEHHYASDRSAVGSLAQAMREGIVPGICLRKVGNRLCVYVAREPVVLEPGEALDEMVRQDQESFDHVVGLLDDLGID